MSIDDELAIYSKIPRPHLPVGQTSYLSDFWPEKFKKQAFRPTPAIDSEIIKTMKVIETGGIKGKLQKIWLNPRVPLNPRFYIKRKLILLILF